MELSTLSADENNWWATWQTTTEQDSFTETFTFAMLETQTTMVNPLIDRIIMTVYLLLILLPGTLLNAFVIHLTAKYDQFQNSYMYVRAATAAFDLAVAWSAVPQTIISDFVSNMPERLVCYSNTIGVAMFFSTAQFPAVVALERYFYFCRPFLYPRIFTKTSVIAATLTVFFLTHGYTFATEIIYEREVQSLVAFCQLVTQAYHTPLQIGLFFLPSMVATIFSIYKVARLINHVKSYPAQHAEHIGNTEQRIRKRAAKRGLRLILLVSGAFWGTTIPCYLYRLAVFQAGYTWDSLNTYENPTISIVYRYTHMSYALSTLLNPIIYLYIYKDFRVAFMRVFGGSGSFSWEENKHSEIGTQ